jgi:hypothetical protein
MANMMQATEKAVRKRANKMLATATKRYKKMMRQATKAANEHKREQYVAAALGALIVTGVVASGLRTRIGARKNATQATSKTMPRGSVKKKSRKKVR